jgi:hypothetical protein
MVIVLACQALPPAIPQWVQQIRRPVSVDQLILTIERAVMTVGGDPEEVTVTVRDPSGRPVEGVALFVNTLDTTKLLVFWKDGKFVTDAKGEATLLVEALQPGYPMLGVRAAYYVHSQPN